MKAALVRYYVASGVDKDKARQLAERYSGHSGRVGFVVAAKEAGAADSDIASTRKRPRPPVASQSTSTGLAGARGEESLTATRTRSAARMRSTRTGPWVCTRALVTSSETTSNTASAASVTCHVRRVREVKPVSYTHLTLPTNREV